jgi:L-arabinokinase
MDVLPPTIFGYLAAQKVSLSAQDGEINLRSAMKDVLVAKGDLHACLVDGARLDFGIPSGYRTTFTQLNALLGNTTAPKPLEQASSKFVGSLSSWLDRVGIRHHADDCADIIHVASSPGRIDLMGGFADYSGSRVLNARTEERCYAFVSLSDRHNNLELTSVQVRSLKDAFYGDSQDQKSEVRRATIPSKVLWGGSDIRSRLTTKSQLRASLERDWPSYLVGVIHAALERQSVGAERFANANNPSKLPAGVCVTVVSDLPWNAGLASSAAVEISTALAMSHALGLPESALHPFNIAAMCKAVENQVVGANCGIMDHLAVACAPDAGNFDTYMLAFDCRWPARTPVMEAVALPAGISVVAVESGVVRSITDPPYENVRVASRIGLGLINEAIRKNSGEGHPVIENLCDVPLSVFQRQYLYLLPERVLGADLVGSTTFDANSELSSFAIDPSFNYRVRAATAHPIEEHARVQTFEAVVKGMHGQQSDVEQARSHELLGELMHQAHASYSNCGLGTQETDLLASLIRNQPSSSVKVIGAKISGGGGGGALSVVLWDDANKSNKTEEFFNEIQAKYYRQTGLICTLRSGASGRMKYHGTIKKP